jgi:Uma2 family endonuclease
VPPARAVHIYIQSVLTRWLIQTAGDRGWAAQEFPYRPATNLQFWYADVAYLPAEHWVEMRKADHPIYAPPLIIEVLSPSNRPAKIQRQIIAAFSGGTREFWVIDPDAQTIEVSLPGASPRVYGLLDSVPVSVLTDASFPVRVLFE